MKKFLGLFTAIILVGVNAFAQYEQESEEQNPWGDKKINFAFYKTLLNQKTCLTSNRHYLGCISSLRTLLEALDPALQIEARDLSPSTYSRIELNAGAFRVVRDFKQSNDQPVLSLQGYFSRQKAKKDNFIQQFTSAYAQEQNSHLPSIEMTVQFIEKNYAIQSIESRVVDAVNEYFHVAIDSHSDYRSKAEIYSSMFGSNRFVGLGIVQEPVPNGTILLRIVKNSGAERAGLRAGDVLTAANRKSLAGMKKAEISAAIRGSENTSIQLDILRNNRKYSIQVTRLKVETKNVESSVFSVYGKKFGYIRLESFMYQPACTEISEILQQFNRDQVQGAILDLRGNGGGYVHITNCLAGLFLGKNKVMGYFEERNSEGELQAKPTLTEMEQVFKQPLSVLIDSESASGSELLSGSLRDHNRALIVGQTSSGKGSMQAPVEELEEHVLYSTQGLFFLPSGRTNQTVGVTPHLSVFRDIVPSQEELYPMTERNMYIFPLEARSISVKKSQAFDTLQVPLKCIQAKDPQFLYKKTAKKNQLKDFQLLTAAAALSCL